MYVHVYLPAFVKRHRALTTFGEEGFPTRLKRPCSTCRTRTGLERTSCARASRHCDKMLVELKECVDDDCTVICKHTVRSTTLVAMVFFLNQINQTHAYTHMIVVSIGYLRTKCEAYAHYQPWCIWYFRYHIMIEIIYCNESSFELFRSHQWKHIKIIVSKVTYFWRCDGIEENDCILITL